MKNMKRNISVKEHLFYWTSNAIIEDFLEIDPPFQSTIEPFLEWGAT